MRQHKTFWLMAIAVTLGLGLTHWDRQAPDARQAIRRSTSFPSADGQKGYLIEKARMYLRESQPHEAREVAKFILENIDAGSMTAFQILRDADVAAREQREAPSPVEPVSRLQGLRQQLYVKI